MRPEQAKEVFEQHKLTGDPLSEEEVSSIVAAGLADETDFWYTLGGFQWEPDRDPNAPKDEGEPDNCTCDHCPDLCPACRALYEEYLEDVGDCPGGHGASIISAEGEEEVSPPTIEP